MASFRPALLVVNMQHDFCHPEEGTVPCIGGALHLAPAINELLNLNFAMKVAIVDAGTPEWVILRDNHAKGKTHCDVKNTKGGRGQESHKFPLHPQLCIKGTKGAEIIGEIEKDKFDLIFEKNGHPDVLMFSAFSDTHGNKKHDLPPNAVSHHLDDELRAKGITHVYCVGTAGDACVPHTAWDAADFGFKAVVLEDVVANLQDDGGKEFEECKRKSAEKGIEYGGMGGEQVRRVRDLGRA